MNAVGIRRNFAWLIPVVLSVSFSSSCSARSVRTRLFTSALAVLCIDSTFGSKSFIPGIVILLAQMFGLQSGWGILSSVAGQGQLLSFKGTPVSLASHSAQSVGFWKRMNQGCPFRLLVNSLDCPICHAAMFRHLFFWGGGGVERVVYFCFRKGLTLQSRLAPPLTCLDYTPTSLCRTLFFKFWDPPPP